MKTNVPAFPVNQLSVIALFRVLTISLLVGVPSTAFAQLGPLGVTPPEITVFHLRHADAVIVADVVGSVFSHESENMSVAVDRRNNALIVRGSADQLKHVNEVVQRLDIPASHERVGLDRPLPTYRVRVVWLMSGLHEGGQQLPADMDTVAAELDRLGFVSPVMVGQTMLTVSAESSFEMSGIARFDRTSDMTVSGLIPSRTIGDRVFLQLRIRCHEIGAPGGALASLETQITSPLGEYLVLGVSPAHEYTSAFVIQVVGSP